MKRSVTKIVSAALAATLLTATAASAAPGDRNYRPAPRTQQNNNNAAVLGFGLLALGAIAIIASQNNKNQSRYDDRYYAQPQRPYYNNGYYNNGYSNNGYNYGPPATYYNNQTYGPYDGYGNGYRR